MKKLFAGIALALLSLAAAATDYGSVYLNQIFLFTVPQGSGDFANTAEFTTTAVSGPATIMVSGGLHISSGSGRGAGYHTEYNTVDVDNVTITDVNGNAICQPVEYTTLTNYGGRAYTSWTCTAANIPAGTYLISFNGHIVSTGNMGGTIGVGHILVSAS